MNQLSARSEKALQMEVRSEDHQPILQLPLLQEAHLGAELIGLASLDLVLGHLLAKPTRLPCQ